jgi:LysR family transcriptional regulator, hydrogen peroxide-inducible genes activator
MTWSPLPFTLRQLQYARAVATELSFRKAAERCRVSQPALSAQLGELEAALGVQLFERDKKRVLVTPAGAELLVRAARVLAEAQSLSEAAQRATDPLSGTLRVGVIPTVSPYLLPALTPRLRAKLPSLRVTWREEKTETVAALLASGELDAGVVAVESDLGDVECLTIARDEFVLVMDPTHPLAKSERAVPSELRNQLVLLLDDGHCFRDQALAFCSRAKAHELEFRATSLSTLVQMVAGGSGITLLPKLAVRTETQRAKLVVRQVSPAPGRTLAVACRRSSPALPVLKRVVELARESYAKATQSG